MIRSALNTLNKRSLVQHAPLIAAARFVAPNMEITPSSFSTKTTSNHTLNESYNAGQGSHSSGVEKHTTNDQVRLRGGSNKDVYRTGRGGTHPPRASTRRNKTPKRKPDAGIVSTEWVSITNIPPLSTLDDLLVDIERITQTELSMGIVDLDAAQKMMDDQSTSGEEQQPQLPIWQPDTGTPYPPHLVVEARLSLSTLKRQAGWYLRFPNRSVVHAILSHIEEANKIETEYNQLHFAIRAKNSKVLKQHKKDKMEDEPELMEIPDFSWNDVKTKPLKCAWKRVTVTPFDINIQKNKIESQDAVKYGISDNVIRAENCSRDSTPASVMHFFSRYDLSDERNDNLKAVEQIVKGSDNRHHDTISRNVTPSTTNSFLVRFSSAADARAAVREKQNVEFMGRRMRLAQYSRQIINEE